MAEKIYDSIIIGAGPGGLQAAIYLARYNRDVIVLDRGGGRTRHAVHIENFFGQPAISGKALIDISIGQARHFNVEIKKAKVEEVLKKEGIFEVHAGERFLSRFVIVSSGATENLPEIRNIGRFFGKSFFTCIDCDGYRTTGKKLLLIGNSPKTVRLAIAMKKLYTKDITLLLLDYKGPEDYLEELKAANIPLVTGRPEEITGGEKIDSVRLKDGRSIRCEVIMSNFGYRLNDEFLQGLPLKRDSNGFKFVTGNAYESSLDGLYIVGPLTGNDQVAIAVGEGATAAIDINKRLLEI